MSSQQHGPLRVETLAATAVNDATGWVRVSAGNSATVSIVDGGSMDMIIDLELETHDTDEGDNLRVETVKQYTSAVSEIFECGEPCRVRLKVSTDNAGTANLRVASTG